jgi:hypothetical protein
MGKQLGQVTYSQEIGRTSSAFALAWWNYSPRSITPPRFNGRFYVPLRFGANWGTSIFEGRGNRGSDGESNPQHSDHESNTLTTTPRRPL